MIQEDHKTQQINHQTAAPTSDVKGDDTVKHAILLRDPRQHQTYHLGKHEQRFIQQA